MKINHIVIAEDERLMRLFLGDLLQKKPAAFKVNLEADSIETLLAELPKTQADVLLLDLGFRQKGLSGLDGLPQLRALHPHLPILVVSRHAGYYSAIKKQVQGYITKDEVPEHLVLAIDCILNQNKSYFSPLVLANDLVVNADEDARLLISRLTKVEKEIVRLTARGLSSKEIARLTNRSPRTVEVILSSQVYPKLGLSASQKNKKVELSRIAIKAGLDGL